MTTPTEFEKYQEEAIKNGEMPLSKDDFNIVMDMMAMQGVVDLSNEKILFQEDGMALIEVEGELRTVYTDQDTIKYESLLREQKKKAYKKEQRKKNNHLKLVG